MQKLILNNWLILAISSLFVGIYISVFENFVADKGYLYFILAVGFGAWYIWKRKQ